MPSSSHPHRKLEALLLSSLFFSVSQAVSVSARSPHYQRSSSSNSHASSSKRALTPGNILASGSSIADAYDFVIAGGGQAGLVLASRLSEDENTTVLVLEAGESGDEVQDQISHPGYTYYKSLAGSEYDYSYKTSPQPHVDGRTMVWPRGKLLGGSSAINGLYYVHPDRKDLDTWQSLIAAGNDDEKLNNEYWGWDSFYSAMKAAEVFGEPTADIKKQAGIEYNKDSFGTGGSVHAAYPGYTFDAVGTWTPTLENMGIPTNPDAYAGNNLGAFVSTSTINPGNWTRSYSRTAYLDPLPPRKNLDILPGAAVTRILFDSASPAGNLTATGVEYATSPGAKPKSIKVNKEVILAGGSIGSPQILQLSGVGPKDVLQDAGIKVLSDLPGVGANLQDHLAAGVTFETSATTANSIRNSGSDFSKSDIFLSFVNSATAYVTTADLIGDSATDFTSSAKANSSTAASHLATESDEVKNGYKKLYETITDQLYDSTNGVGQVELLLTMAIEGKLIIQAALQHPLSSGRITVQSKSPFDAPRVDPRYLEQATDVVMLREGLKLARKVGNTAPLSDILGGETNPGPSVKTDEQWDAWLAGQVGTEYHPSGTCAMLPKDMGGVVNARLQVYGLANVRVADASVYPLSMTTHLGAPTYALAEQASTMIRAFYNAAAEPAPGSDGSNDSSDSNGSGNGSEGSALRLGAFSSTSMLFVAGVLTLLVGAW